MREEIKAILILLLMFVLLFANIFKDRNFERKDENVDKTEVDYEQTDT